MKKNVKENSKRKRTAERLLEEQQRNARQQQRIREIMMPPVKRVKCIVSRVLVRYGIQTEGGH